MDSNVMSRNVALLKMAAVSVGGSPVTVNELGETIVGGEETDGWIAKAEPYIVQLVSGAAFLFGFLSLYFIVSRLVDLMSLCVLVLSVIVVLQKKKLEQNGGFRGQHNALRSKINDFKHENERLSGSVNTLQVESDKLKGVETELSRIASESNRSVETLTSIVTENGELQQEILDNLNASVVRQIMSLVLHTDSDRNFVLSKSEVDMLVLRLKHMPGVHFDEAVFRSIIKNDKGELTLSDVCEITRNLKNSEQKMVTRAAPTIKSRAFDPSAVPTAITEPIFTFQPSELLKQQENAPSLEDEGAPSDRAHV